MPSLSPARRAAFDVLQRVESGAYASDLLRATCAGLDPRDAGLAGQIVFGVLRRQMQLDAVLSQLLPKPRLDSEVRIALCMGVFQLLYLDRVPAHAIVSDAVELVKRARKRSAAGLVNAVLRKAPKLPREFPAPSVRFSTPAWLLERWTAQFGQHRAHVIAEASLREPDAFVHALEPPPVANEPTAIVHCYRLLESPPDGLRTMDIGSQWIVTLLELSTAKGPLLDICAAPGGKTRIAIESGIPTFACDLHFSRLRELTSLGCPLLQLDATQPLPFRRAFDRILVDAPCSGTGTLARNPEIKWRLQPESLPTLHETQVKILRNALQCLSPDGILVYSTCSLEREENEAVVLEATGALANHEYRIPGVHDGDGFFAAVIRSN